jgi:hypothetical protein
MDLIGKMDKRVAFQTNNPAASGAGGRDVYSTVFTAWGYLKYNGGNRDGSYGDILGNQSATLTARKQQALVAVLGMSLRVVIDGQVWTVQGFEQLEGELYYRFSITRQQNG